MAGSGERVALKFLPSMERVSSKAPVLFEINHPRTLKFKGFVLDRVRPIQP